MELAAQGFANVVSSTIGGMPGAGTMGASLVNLSSGAKTRLSGIIEGVMATRRGAGLGGFCCMDSDRDLERRVDRCRFAHDRYRSFALPRIALDGSGVFRWFWRWLALHCLSG